MLLIGNNFNLRTVVYNLVFGQAFFKRLACSIGIFSCRNKKSTEKQSFLCESFRKYFHLAYKPIDKFNNLGV